MMPAVTHAGAAPAALGDNIVYCDGGLCNRLNALIYALVLRNEFGGRWSASWPRNNWCGAAFGSLFVIDMPVLDESLARFTDLQDRYLFLVHENQNGVREETVVYNRSLTSLEDFGKLINAGRPVFYYHNLLPHPVDLGLIRLALGRLRVVPAIWRRAQDFCRANAIDGRVVGLHIRKTDFGAAIDDAQLFDSVAAHPGRFFVCSDDPGVNERFGRLKNCAVLEKPHFPQKLHSGDWNAATIDGEGRRFPYNITRTEESVVDALADLLILSTTTLVPTSPSTFLGMAGLFKAANFFCP